MSPLHNLLEKALTKSHLVLLGNWTPHYWKLNAYINEFWAEGKSRKLLWYPDSSAHLKESYTSQLLLNTMYHKTLSKLFYKVKTWSWTTNESAAFEFCSVVKVSPPAEEESWSDRLPEFEEFSMAVCDGILCNTLNNCMRSKITEIKYLWKHKNGAYRDLSARCLLNLPPQICSRGVPKISPNPRLVFLFSVRGDAGLAETAEPGSVATKYCPKQKLPFQGQEKELDMITNSIVKQSRKVRNILDTKSHVGQCWIISSLLHKYLAH